MYYRKKPVVIEARQLTDDFAEAGRISAWCHGELTDRYGEGISIAIPTLEGVTVASPKDFVIKGVKGEFYACKPDIFEATYEQVDGPDA
jgi:hypothetical protein